VDKSPHLIGSPPLLPPATPPASEVGNHHLTQLPVVSGTNHFAPSTHADVFCLCRHRVANDTLRAETLHAMVGSRRYCWPRYRMPFHSQDKECVSGVDDAAGNVCQSLVAGTHASRVRRRHLAHRGDGARSPVWARGGRVWRMMPATSSNALCTLVSWVMAPYDVASNIC